MMQSSLTTSELALLLVDVQRDFWRPLSSVPEFAAFPANVQSLLSVARAHRLPVMHLQSVFRADRSDWMLFYRRRGRIPCIAGTEGALIEEFAAPHSGETMITKQTFDGFVNTPLEQVLRELGVRALLVAGLETSVCVLLTATSAYLRQFVPLVVGDACADLPDRHAATLQHYAGLCFQTVSTERVQRDLPGVLELAAVDLPPHAP